MVNIAILIVSKFRCHCSACGREALSNEIRHGEVRCGARFVATGSEYPDFEEHCRRVRPDLPFIDVNVNKGDAVELPRGFPI